MKATMIDGKDNVAVVLSAVDKSAQVEWSAGAQSHAVTAVEAIPLYHKIAVRDIPKGTPVVKYGEHIGIAATDISAGCHVHIHNVQNNREAL